MRVVVVYESMFGSTREVAEAIAEGLGPAADARVVGVAAAVADASLVDDADLVVVGGPTQAWSMSRRRTRGAARDYARQPGSALAVEPSAGSGPGVREWIAGIGLVSGRAAAFDTRLKAPAMLTGRASRAIARALERHGLVLVAPPASFFVRSKSGLQAGELDRARAFGARL
nr:flavodoxin domain-containing protein [Actinomycetota bacterium]